MENIPDSTVSHPTIASPSVSRPCTSPSVPPVRESVATSTREKMPRALARLQDYNSRGKLEDIPENRVLDNNIEDVLSVTIPHNMQNNAQCIEAKQQELQKLKEFDVYEEVINTGQDCISTKWVVVQKGQKIKARLVARGFEEDLCSAVDFPRFSLLRSDKK